MDKNNNTEFKDIFKSNAVFGGIKIFELLVTFLKGKIVAIILGPAGIGVQTLLVSTINTIHQLSNLGFPQSSVREISVEEDSIKKKKKIATTQILSCILGLLGSIFCIIFSSKLSEWIFKDCLHSWMFIVVSVSLFFQSITAAQISILQGLRKVRLLALASLIGSILNLVFAVPLYYYWHLIAIPYAITLGYIISSFVLLWFVKKEVKSFQKLQKNEAFDTSKKILRLGVTLMIGNCIMSLLSMCLVLVINRIGNNSDVGFYQAATNCTYMAINIIISVLASDYYPRISQVVHDTKKMNIVISTQIELLLLILTPIVCVMVSYPALIIRLFYSSEFLVVDRAVQIIAIALFFRIMWHSLSYVILAKGDTKTYLIFDAIIGNGIFFTGNMFGFYFGGINGIALSYIIGSIVVFVILCMVVNLKYKISLSKNLILLLISSLILTIALFLSDIIFEDTLVKRIFEMLFVILVSIYTIKSVNNKTGMLTYIYGKILYRK